MDKKLVLRRRFTDAHEAPIYVEAQQRVYFATLPEGPKGQPRISIRYWDLASDAVITWIEDARMANGMQLSCDQRCLLVCEQGDQNTPAAISKINLATKQREVVISDCTATPFNSPNKVIEVVPGTYIFTDPDYGPRQGFRQNRTKPATYLYSAGKLRKLATGLQQPHGLALSPDKKTLYISDTAADDGVGGYFPELPHGVYSYALDLNSYTLSNRRCIFEARVGIPDGLACDREGRLYAATGSGVNVYADTGEELQHYPVAGGAVNLWLDEVQRRMFVTADDRIEVLDLR